MNELLLGGLVRLFSIPGLALILSLLILAACVLIVAGIWRERSRPVRRTLDRRLGVLRDVMPEALSTHEAEEAFADRFDEIDEALSAGGPGSVELRRAWIEYKETLIRDDKPIRNTVRPETFFGHVGDDLRLLGWWANIFVAIGLVFTFLGLVAALKVASDGMHGSHAEQAIPELLRIASSKFFTSIAGVASSIVCRIAERRMRVRLRREVAALSGYLERGLRYSPPQAIAAEQLVQLREQSSALKIFKTELAASIGEQFERQNQPVISVLGDISRTLQQVKEEGFAELTGGIGDAISKNAGREMTALSEALTQMTHQFGSVHERIEAGGDLAGQRIKEAADQFAAASAGMSLAFAELNDRIDAMATKMTDQGAIASQAAADQFDSLLGRYHGVAEENASLFEHGAAALRDAAGSAGSAISEQVGRQLNDATARFASTAASMDAAFSDLAARLESQAARAESEADASSARSAARFERVLEGLEAVGLRNADAFDQAAGVLNRAATDAAVAARGAIDEAMAASASQGSEALRNTLGEFRETFARETRSLASAVSESTARFTTLAQGLDQTVRAAGLQTQRMAETAQAAQAASASIAQAAADIDRAAAPVRDSTRAVADAVIQMRSVLDASVEASRAATGESRALADQMRATASEADRAWQAYSARFAGVDEDLGEALRQITDAVKGNADHLTDHVNKIDKGLAEAVTRLAQQLEPIKDLADQQEELIEELTHARQAAHTPEPA